jgi:GAF domain-containing protein
MSQEPAAWPGVTAFLELLIANASPGEFEEPLLRALLNGAPGPVLDELERAKKLALAVDERLRRLDRRRNELAGLMDTARDLGEQKTLDALLTTVVRRARLLLHVDVTCAHLYDDQGQALHCTSDGAASAFPSGTSVPPGWGLGSVAMRTRTVVWTSDYLADDRIPHHHMIDNFIRDESLEAVIAVPLRKADRVIGMLYCGDRSRRSYTADEIALLTALADHAATDVEHLHALDEANARIAEVTAARDRLQAQVRTEQHVAEIRRPMVDLVLSGGDAQELATVLTETLGGTVLIRDEKDRQVALVGDAAAFDDDELTAAALEARADNTVVHLDNGISVAPVRAGAEDLGSLALLRHQPLDEPDLGVLDNAAQAAAMSALLSRSTAAVGQHDQDEALDELLDSPLRGSRRQRQYTRRLGMDLNQPHVMVVARAEGGRRSRADMWASSYASARGGARAARDGYLVLLVPGENPGTVAREVARDLGRTLDQPVTAGGAATTGRPDSVPRAYQQARQSLEALTALGRQGTAATVAELGFVGMLLGDGRDVDGYIEATLGPVLTYDADRSTELSSTLAAYFAAGGSPTYAAEALQVHPNTVARRLERISQLLGVDLQDSEPALEIQLALRLQRIRTALRDGRPPAGDAPTAPVADDAPAVRRTPDRDD